ncbi:hypothetical protein FB479_102756 [Brevibacillus sp. AG162]|uniref:hypothetical protein n=1 Tax=Brevibacillus sp. AG162 TaxID=2572910 RepID=UPI001153F857|nr:hypothetical protein [Brevibacillus sp. AG162]TQK74115.1 hypothetical protein FB479_102756 [Brevibacillus sp. AG162]
MTYTNNNMMQSQQQPQFFGAVSPAGSMFQPGFAGTNVQEVQYWNQGGHAPQSIGAPSSAVSFSGGVGGAQSIFSPGFANTNAQEVRQQNASYPAQQQQQQQFGFGQNQASQYIQAQPSYQPAFSGGANSIFSPGFAGTNVQEVQARNQAGYSSFAGPTGFAGQAGFVNQAGNAGQAGFVNQAGNAGSIFSPGFAGTNVQEVRQLNNTGFGLQAQQPQQQQQAFANTLGMGAQSVFTPGFAGTNVQEVRQLNAPGQAAPHTGSIFPGTF